MDYLVAAICLKAMTDILETELSNDIYGRIVARTGNGTEERFRNRYADSDSTEKFRALPHVELGTF